MNKPMTERGMSPRELDWRINGVPVYIYKRPNGGVIYPSMFDFDRFGVEALATVRVPIAEVQDMTDPEELYKHPKVVAKLKELTGVNAV
jgi:hypothetical protein